MRLPTAQRAPARFSDTQLAAIREGASIVAFAERFGVQWDQRKTKASAGRNWACCPFHEERTPSFHVQERFGRFKCFGCGERGDVFALVQKLQGCSFREAVRTVAGGDVVAIDPELIEAREQARREREAEQARKRVSDRATAAAIYEAAGVHVSGTLGELYLRKARQIKAPLGGAELRFHARAPLSPYEPSKAGRCPAIVAAIRNVDGEHIGTHLTFLHADGGGKRCFDFLDGGARMICGEHRAGFIRLGIVRDAAVIGEGVETTLSASEACGLPGLAAINAGNMRALVLPERIKRVVIAYDRDRKGVGQISGEALAERLWSEGRTVEMLPPPDGHGDWNDAAKAGALLEACA